MNNLLQRLMKEATRLYQQAAATTPMDAMERLDVEMARVELEDYPLIRPTATSG